MCQRNIRVSESMKWVWEKKSIYFFPLQDSQKNIHMKRKRRRKKKKEKKNCGKKTSPLSIDQGSWVVKTKTARFDSDERRTLYSGGVKRKENRTLWGSNSLQQLIMRGKEITTKYGFFIGRKIFFKLFLPLTTFKR